MTPTKKRGLDLDEFATKLSSTIEKKKLNLSKMESTLSDRFKPAVHTLKKSETMLKGKHFEPIHMRLPKAPNTPNPNKVKNALKSRNNESLSR